MKRIIGALLLLLLAAYSAQAQTLSGNGYAQVARPNNTTAYTTTQLIANNTANSVAPTPLVINGTQLGTDYIVRAIAQTSYTGATAPPQQTWWIFSTPNVTVLSLVDTSTYVGPYASDFTNDYVVGSIICNQWQKTNDGSAQWQSECSGPNGGVVPPLAFNSRTSTTTLYALLETAGSGYTPVANETETLLVTSARGGS